MLMLSMEESHTRVTVMHTDNGTDNGRFYPFDLHGPAGHVCSQYYPHLGFFEDEKVGGQIQKSSFLPEEIDPKRYEAR